MGGSRTILKKMEEMNMNKQIFIKIAKRAGILLLLICLSMTFSHNGQCKAAAKTGFITKVQGNTIYCTFLNKKGLKQGSTVYFFPKKGYITGTVKYPLDSNVKLMDELDGKTVKKIPAVKRKLSKLKKEHKKGLPVYITVKNGKCVEITRRMFM